MSGRPALRTRYTCVCPMALLLLTTGCVGEAGVPGLDQDPARKPYIVGGKGSDSFPATGSFRYQGKHFCTATLVRPNKVLTAAHCFDPPTSQYYNQVDFVLGVNSNSSQVRSRVASFVKHPNYTKNGYFRDMAVVTLATPITKVKPVLVYLGDPTSLKGKAMVLVGFGRSGNDATQGIRREVEVSLSDVLQYKISYPWKGQGSCYGDSGGPAYIQAGGKWRQVGITSHGTLGTPNCQEKAYYTRIDAHKAFLAAQGIHGADRPLLCGKDSTCDGACRQDQDCKYLNSGGGAPPPGGNPPPGGGTPPPGGSPAPPGGGAGGGIYGAPCSQNSQCKSGLCTADPNGAPSFCTRSCSATSGCPYGHQCYATQYPNLNICAPGGSSPPAAPRPFSTSCSKNSDCISGYCAGHPGGGGYCTYGCDYYYGCPSGSRCLPTQYSGIYLCGPYGY